MWLVDNAVGFMTGPVAHPAKGDAMMGATTSAEIAGLIARVTLLPPAPEAVSSIHLWIELSERPFTLRFSPGRGPLRFARPGRSARVCGHESPARRPSSPVPRPTPVPPER